MPSTSRPQTLKQAKRAYRKSSGIPRLSASEIAQAERRAALQERADRIKEREARRKLNLKKREEKIARERETAKRTGRPFVEDAKPAWKIGPSQLSLGKFLGGVDKPQPVQVSMDLQLKENCEDLKMMVWQGQSAVDQSAACVILASETLAAPLMQDHERFPLKNRSPNSSATRMPPPPPRPQVKAIPLADYAFDDCFPSNTQIERELSPSLVKPVVIVQHQSLSLASNTTKHCSEDSNEWLACLSTQDLDFSQGSTQNAQPVKDQQDADILAQICTQDLDFEDEPSRPIPEVGLNDSETILAQICTQDLDLSDDIQADTKPLPKEFDDGFMDDEELEDLAVELEEEFAAERRMENGLASPLSPEWE